MTIEQLTTRTYADLHSKGTFFAPRTTIEHTKWVLSNEYQVEAVTGATLGLMGEMPLVCHQAAATPSALEFITISGLSTPKILHTYGTEDEALSLAQGLIGSGLKLVYFYPPSPTLDANEGLLVPISLYNTINNKSCIHEFVDKKYIPKRRIIPAEEIGKLITEPPGNPVYIKAGVQGACGFGVGVEYCTDATAWRTAITAYQSRQSELSSLVIEEAIDVATCWCLGVSIMEDHCQYLGGSIQLFNKPGKQSGNRIDPNFAIPDEAVRLALSIANIAHQRGYRGIAGFDIGVNRSNRLFVFDLNFRLNGSTAQLLIHDAASMRIGAQVSQSFRILSDNPLNTILERLLPFARSGVIVPTRFFDRDKFHEHYPDTDAKSAITGIIFANSVSEINGIETAINNLACK